MNETLAVAAKPIHSERFATEATSREHSMHSAGWWLMVSRGTRMGAGCAAGCFVLSGPAMSLG